MASRWYDLGEVDIKKETESAFLVVYDNGEEEAWIPKSQIREPDQYSEGDEDVDMEITNWIAQEKGIA